MTRTASSFTLPSALAGRALRVSWRGLVARRDLAPRPQALVVRVEPVDASRVVLEAWVETCAGRRHLVARQGIPGALVRDDGMLHVDVALGGRCALALTVDERVSAERPLFARTDLLDDAGFAPGGYDPPTIRLADADEDAARTAS